MALCKRGHERPAAGRCAECQSIRAREWREANPDRHRAAVAAHRARHPERARIKDKAYKAANPARSRLYAAHQRARVVGAMPAWVDTDALLAVYLACPTGLEVDHIIPLQSEAVCGLHVPWNLQYLTRSDNARKNNRVEA